MRSLGAWLRGRKLLEEGEGEKGKIVKSCGTVFRRNNNGLASVYSRRGEKGINQDCAIVWEEFGCEEDMILCGIFDGHGPWGHYVAKNVRESLPPLLLHNWKEAQTLSVNEKETSQFDTWKQSFLTTCAAVDKQLECHRKFDTFNSGTTALTIVKQGPLMVIANVGDSRAVLATTSDNGSLVPIQLTMDFKPHLPQEAERITQCKGLVFCLRDEPGIFRLWRPNGKMPGLAMSRAFGDYCIKKYGLISIPEVTKRVITDKDHFVVLATDGVWDVISNEEAVNIVSSTKDKSKAAKRLVECAVRAWKRKRRDIAVDDCSAICLFFHS